MVGHRRCEEEGQCNGNLNADGAAKPKPANKGTARGARAQRIRKSTNHVGFLFLCPLE